MGLFHEAEFWFTIAVLIFVAILWKPARKFLIGGLDARAERIAAQSARAIEDALQRRQRLAEERIAQEEARAVAEIRGVTVDVAISAARRVIASELDEKRGAALIDAAIAELPNQLH